MSTLLEPHALSHIQISIVCCASAASGWQQLTIAILAGSKGDPDPETLRILVTLVHLLFV